MFWKDLYLFDIFKCLHEMHIMIKDERKYFCYGNTYIHKLTGNVEKQLSGVCSQQTFSTSVGISLHLLQIHHDGFSSSGEGWCPCPLLLACWDTSLTISNEKEGSLSHALKSSSFFRSSSRCDMRS